MNSPSKILPIGIETFSTIRKGNYYYVDKTEFAWNLTQQAGRYFLSRPRRFGKSLFLDTLRELFEGNQALFEGLFIHDKWDWTRRFPVIHLTFSGGVITSKAELDQKIVTLLARNQKRLGVQCQEATIAAQFFELIELAHEKYGVPVVVLVDEYDKPILDNILDSASALAVREGLKSLYSVIKEADAHIHFVLLTGVSKFSKVNLFSGINNLRDITLSEPFSAICGYTETDVDTVFADQIPGLDRDKIRRWYNGYNWTGVAVYNPFDLLLLFAERQFGAWWCSTGTPTFLFEMMQQYQFFTPRLAELRAGAELISALDVDQMTPEALLFQTGYLTIKKINHTLSGSRSFTLGYPNIEVEQSLNTSLLAAYIGRGSGSGGDTEIHRQMLEDLLRNHDMPGMRALFHAFFASIPNQWYSNNPIAQYEGFYASVFYSYFAALGLETRVEDATNLGRIDMMLKTCGRIYLFEFKVVEGELDGTLKAGVAADSPALPALQQIKDKGYAEKYRAEGLPIYLIGVAFSKARRNVVGFEVEQLEVAAVP